MNPTAGIEGTAFTQKPLRVVALALCLVALACTRRAGPMDGTDSTSHWLLECSTDGQCGDGESCLCGVCTRECTESSDCTDLAADAECGSPTVCEGISACLLACTGDDDCPSASSTCDEERCVNVEATGGSGGQGPGESGGSSTNEGGSRSAGNSTSGGTGGAPTSGGAPAVGGTGGAPTSGGAPAVGGTTSSLSEADALGAIPAGCEFLVERTDPNCTGYDAACEQARTEPVRERSYSLVIAQEQLTSAEVDARVQCVVDWLAALGLIANATSRFVSSNGTWNVMQHVVRTAILQSYQLTCDEHCDYCYDLTETDCSGDAFCAAFSGQTLDSVRECLEPKRFAACVPMGRECGAAFSAEIDGDGQCWLFTGVCAVPGFTEDPTACAAAQGMVSCADVSDCFSPTTNQDRVGETGFPGCACEADSAGYCSREGHALICDDSGSWQSVIDGPCFGQGLCDRLVPDATTCGQGFWTCIELEDGAYCAIEPRDGSYAMLTEEQCASVGGEVAELGCPEPSFGRLHATVDGAGCCTPNSGKLTIDECESLGGTAVEDPGDYSLIACPDDGDLVAVLRPGDFPTGGLCCF